MRSRLAVLTAVAAIITATTVTPAAAATAGPSAAAGTTAQRIAQALTAAPVYVDPSEASALPAAGRSSLLAAIGKAPAPVFVVLTPLIAGDEFGGDPHTLLSVVHGVLDKPGVYVTMSGSYGDVTADQYGEESLEETVFDAEEAASFGLPDGTTAATRLQRFVSLLSDPAAAAAAQSSATQRLDQGGSSGSSPAAAPSSRHSSAGDTAIGAVVLVLLVVLLVLVTRWLVRRRRAATLAPGVALTLPPEVFAAARAGAVHDLRSTASSAVVDLGELLDHDDLAPATAPAAAQGDLQRALDAYDAAGRVMDHAADTADLAGVLVLVDVGRGALARAHAEAAGTTPPAYRPLCFFNPLHGRSTRTSTWRDGGRQLQVPTCTECAADVKAGRQPDALVDAPLDGRAGDEKPYYATDATRSVWAATGYGAFGTDLVRSVLEGHRYGRR